MDADPLDGALTVALDTFSNGSGIPIPLGGVISAFLQRESQRARELLLEEIRRGKISATNLPDEATLGGYVLRVVHAVARGTASNNLVLLARYLFGDGAGARNQGRTFADISILEGLSDSELRALAVIKHSLDAGLLYVEDKATGGPRERPSNLSILTLPLLDLFETQDAFREAAYPLVRFGFIRFESAWGGMALSATPEAARFLGELDLEGIVF